MGDPRAKPLSRFKGGPGEIDLPGKAKCTPKVVHLVLFRVQLLGCISIWFVYLYWFSPMILFGFNFIPGPMVEAITHDLIY
jgi:hypothetical protein